MKHSSWADGGGSEIKGHAQGQAANEQNTGGTHTGLSAPKALGGLRTSS